MSKSFVLGFIVGIVFLFVGGIAGTRTQLKDQRKYEEEKFYKKEIVDATPVELGVLTDQQRIHSMLYRSYQERTKSKISELIANNKHKVLGIELQVGLEELLTKPETPENYL